MILKTKTAQKYFSASFVGKTFAKEAAKPFDNDLLNLITWASSFSPSTLSREPGF